MPSIDQKAALVTGLNFLLFLFLCIALGIPQWLSGPLGPLGAHYKMGLFKRCDYNEDGSKTCYSAILECVGNDACKTFNSKTRATAAMLFFSLFANLGSFGLSLVNLVRFQGIDAEKLWKGQTILNGMVTAFTMLAWIIYASQDKQGEGKFSSGFALTIVSTFFAIGLAGLSWWQSRQRGRTYTAGTDASFGYNRT